MSTTQNNVQWQREYDRRAQLILDGTWVAPTPIPPPAHHIKRIGKKRWGVFYGSSQRVVEEFRGSWPSAKQQFAVWKVTRRLGV